VRLSVLGDIAAADRKSGYVVPSAGTFGKRQQEAPYEGLLFALAFIGS